MDSESHAGWRDLIFLVWASAVAASDAAAAVAYRCHNANFGFPVTWMGLTKQQDS